MRIVALNASPRRWDGNTHRLLEPFLRGARQAGATVRRYYVPDLDVHSCVGCYACLETGYCHVDDDMRWLLEEVRAADALVLGFPLYMGGTPGPLKTVVDRLRPLAPNPLIPRDLTARTGDRAHPGPARLVMASVGGVWETDGFRPCIDWFEGLCRDLGARCAGRLIRPHVHAWAALAPWSSRAACIDEALEDAGRELVLEGRVSPESEAIIAAPVLHLESVGVGRFACVG